ncbi:Bifunctional acetylxylan esterase/xylanase XynS20E-like protein [Cladobotryum mycophilum]|uniref:feruloyl esterase n=1 Tax=Cladobotryum mycophilum TaxID=491253 RepID=A0ABR0SID9_9HYPO
MLVLSSVLVGALALFQGTQAAAIVPKAAFGCGRTHGFIGQSKDFDIDSSGGNRSYRIHLPSGYTSSKPWPLLVAFHGRGETPESIENYTQFSNETVNPNMVVVYPAGEHEHWEGASYSTPGVSDKEFATDLVQHLQAQYCIDASRIYAMGRSNGGGFVDSLACSADHSGIFAAFAMDAAALYNEGTNTTVCNPDERPVPVFETHSMDDHTIPYTGGKGDGGTVPPIPVWLDRWADRNRCTSNTTTMLPNDVEDIQWTCGGVDGILRHVRVPGRRHKYPGETNDDIFLSPVILEWLSRFTKPQ